MSTIFKTDNNYDFSKLKLNNPKGLQGGAYFSKITLNDHPVLIQTPKCLTKDGIHKTEKRIYCDLKFSDSNEQLFKWIETLEEKIQNLIYDKKDIWFHNDMDMDSIEYYWQNLLRTYKKNFQLLRTFVQKPRNFDSARLIQIYDEQENQLSLDDIKSDTEIISILEITGLKFTSQSFNLEFYLRQIMVLKNKPLFTKCLISLSDGNAQLNKIEPIKLKTTESLEETYTNDKLHNHTIKTENKTIINDDDNTSNEIKHINNNLTDANIDNNNLNIEKNTNNLETLNDKVEHSTENLEDNSNIKKETSTENHNKNYNNNDNDNNNNNNNNNDGNDKVEEINIDSFKKDVKDEIEIIEKTLEKNDNSLTEIDIKLPKKENSIKLKSAKDVYLEIYKEARKKARDAKREAIKTYLEEKKIKSTYLLDDYESSDDDLEDYSDLFN